MRLSLLYLFVILTAFSGNRPITTRWVIMSGCSLKVDGSTNINKFSCAIANYSTPDTIFAVRVPNQPIGLRGHISLDVQQFDCHNAIMTADLRKTLKSNTFPKLTIRFLSMSKYPEVAGRETIKGQVTIELAGVTRQFDVDYTVSALDSRTMTLIGTRQLNFSDFNITPPRKLGGMIRTNNELAVVFNLHLQILN